jgi:cytochrome oxidase Cu insertion factor (SCO1/SenC/PrrC family)
MHRSLRLALGLLLLAPAADLRAGDDAALPEKDSKEDKEKEPKSVFDFKVKTILGEEFDLEQLAGKHALLIVNVASQ